MTVNRRGLLGLLGGAAAAGPKLAKSIADDIGKSRPMGGFGDDYSETGTSQSGHAAWEETRKKILQRVITGKSAAEKKKQKTLIVVRRLDDLERLRLDSLRSVSPGQKMRILIDGMADRDERARIAGAEFELADLLNPLKGI